jgi:hypothetical protein
MKHLPQKSASPYGNNSYARSLRLGRWDQTKKPGYSTYQNHIKLSRVHYHHGTKSCKQWYKGAMEKWQAQTEPDQKIMCHCCKGPDGFYSHKGHWAGNPSLGSRCEETHDTNGYWYCEFCNADHHGVHGLAFELGGNGSVDLYYEQRIPEAERLTAKAPLYKSRPVHYSQEYKHWRDHVRSEINR